MALERRGRPKGRLKGTRVAPRVQIVEWKPVHETICTLHVLGKKNVEIAEKLKLSPVTVSNVLHSDKGKDRIKILYDDHIKAIRQSHEGRISEIKEQAVKNVHSLITDKKQQETKPFALAEFSLKALAALDNKKDVSNQPNTIQNNQFNTIIANPELAARLANGLDKLTQIANRHAGK